MNATPLTEAEVVRLRADFPALHQEVQGKPLVYLDNAASSHTPEPVLAAMDAYYRRDRANVHRGVHELSQRASASFDAVRRTVARRLGGVREEEVVLTRGTTESINLVAQTWGLENLRPGDEIVVTAMEHHANLVPWHLLARRTGAVIRAIPFDDRGVLDLGAAAAIVGPRTKLLAFNHVSNALGTVNPVAELARLGRAVGATILVDGAQAVPHLAVDLPSLDVDFYAFSGHKACGPTGVGALWGRYALLEAMPPWQGGGDMIERVQLTESTYQPPPLRFEAGTPDIAGVIGLGPALDYLAAIGLDRIAAREHELLAHATEAVAAIPRVRLVGTAPHKAAVLAFVVDGAHPTDVGMLLDSQGVAVRTGHHCAQPVMDAFGVPATVRASFAFYNTHEEVDRFAAALHKVLSWI